MTAAMLEDVTKWEVNEEAVKVFCEKNSFLFQQLGSPETKTLLSRSARDCFGDSVIFELWPAEGLNNTSTEPPNREESDAADASPTSSAIEEARDSKAVKTALDVFHGTIKEVKLFGSDTGDKE
jgi:hypothetical protein